MTLLKKLLNEYVQSDADENKLYPVYVILVNGDDFIQNSIKLVTRSEYSHATISLDSSMNHMYSVQRLPFAPQNKANGISIGIESMWSYHWKNTVYFTVYVTFVNKDGYDKIKNTLNDVIDNCDKYRYNYLGCILSYFHIKGKSKIDDPKKIKYFCSEFVAEILNAGGIEGPDNTLLLPYQLTSKNYPNSFYCGTYTPKNFKETELLRKVSVAEKEFRSKQKLDEDVILYVESSMEELDPLTENSLHDIKEKINNTMNKILLSDVPKYTSRLDWKKLYDSFIKLFPNSDPDMRFSLIELIVKKYLVPNKASTQNVTDQIIGEMKRIRGTVRTDKIDNISVRLSCLSVSIDGKTYIYKYPENSLSETVGELDEFGLGKFFSFSHKSDKDIEREKFVKHSVDKQSKNLVSEKDRGFISVKKIVDTMSKKDLMRFTNGTFKDSPYVVYRDIESTDKGSGFLDIYLPIYEGGVKLIDPETGKDSLGFIVVAVEKTARKIGIAETLVKRAIKNAPKHLEVLIWKCDKDNIASFRLAKKCGFRPFKDAGNSIYLFINRKHLNETSNNINESGVFTDIKILGKALGKDIQRFIYKKDNAAKIYNVMFNEEDFRNHSKLFLKLVRKHAVNKKFKKTIYIDGGSYYKNKSGNLVGDTMIVVCDEEQDYRCDVAYEFICQIVDEIKEDPEFKPFKDIYNVDNGDGDEGCIYFYFKDNVKNDLSAAASLGLNETANDELIDEGITSFLMGKFVNSKLFDKLEQKGAEIDKKRRIKERKEYLEKTKKIVNFSKQDLKKHEDLCFKLVKKYAANKRFKKTIYRDNSLGYGFEINKNGYLDGEIGFVVCEEDQEYCSMVAFNYISQIVDEIQNDRDFAAIKEYYSVSYGDGDEGCIYFEAKNNIVNDIKESAAPMNEFIQTGQINSREERDKYMNQYGLRPGGYGQRTKEEDERLARKSDKWEKKVSRKERKKIYREGVYEDPTDNSPVDSELNPFTPPEAWKLTDSVLIDESSNLVYTSDRGFKLVNNIVKTLSKEDLLRFTSGTFKDSDRVVYRAILATSKGKGFIDVYRYVSGGKSTKSGFIVVAVEKPARKDSLAKSLVMKAITECPSDVTKLIWRCDKDNIASCKLAESCGFVKTGETKNQLSFVYDRTKRKLTEAVVPFLKSFKIRFDDKGNLDISRKEYDDFGRHINNSLRILRVYKKENNILGIKNELCRLYYMVELIDKYYAKDEYNGEDFHKDMIDKRSIMLNAFTNYIRDIVGKEPEFDFTNYYNNSEYGRNIKVNVKGLGNFIGKTITTLL